MLEERFADGNSFIHRLDPRVKIVLALAFSVMTAVANRVPALFLALGLAAILIALARLPARAVLRRIMIVNGFVVFLWLMLPVTYPGESLFSVGPLVVSREGVHHALLITLKSNAIIVACIALLSTTRLVAVGRALGRLYVPEKIVHVLLFTLRYLGAASEEYRLFSTSMKLRCLQPRTDLHTYRSYAHMVGMLLISSYEKAQAVYAAMLCRGFTGKFCALDDFAVTVTDVLFAACVSATLLAIGLLQWT